MCRPNFWQLLHVDFTQDLVVALSILAKGMLVIGASIPNSILRSSMFVNSTSDSKDGLVKASQRTPSFIISWCTKGGATPGPGICVGQTEQLGEVPSNA